MSTNGIKIAQQYGFDGRTASHHVGDDVFSHLFGGAIGGGGFFGGGVFCDGVHVGLAIHGARRREHKPLHPIHGHQIQQINENVEVVAIIEDGLGDGFAHGFAGSKIDDAVDAGVRFK